MLKIDTRSPIYVPMTREQLREYEDYQVEHGTLTAAKEFAQTVVQMMDSDICNDSEDYVQFMKELANECRLVLKALAGRKKGE